jgi:orsellinic acid C2-O-methyltransferase
MTQPADSVEDSARLSSRFQDLLSGAWTTQVIYVAAELRIADHLATGQRKAADLAAITESHEPSLTRLLHSLTAIGICSHNADDFFDLTPLGNLLRSDASDSLHSWSLWWGRSLWNAWANLLYSVRTGESARAHLSGTQGFDHLEHDRAAAETFYRATVELSRHSAQAILAAYDFTGCTRIADVGGGYGELLILILRAHPSAAGVLFELPQAIPGARQHLENSGIARRCEIIEGDFFTEVPRNCDLYVLKSVLHDWSDDRALEILRVCHKSMNDSARLLIIEQQVPERREPIPSGLAVSDLTMLVAHGSRERTQSDLEALLHAAGFAVRRNIPVTATLVICEASPEPHRDLRQNL